MPASASAAKARCSVLCNRMSATIQATAAPITTPKAPKVHWFMNSPCTRGSEVWTVGVQFGAPERTRRFPLSFFLRRADGPEVAMPAHIARCRIKALFADGLCHLINLPLHVIEVL